MRHAILAVIVATTAVPAHATVTTATRTVTYSPTVSTTVFSVTYPFIAANQLVVVKITDATGAETTLTQGTDYTVTLPVGTTLGYVTTTSAVTSTHSIRIDRQTPLTQATSFTTQGRFRPADLENALDKLTMITQEISVGTATDSDITTAITAHAAAADPHTGYAILLGRAGGQNIRGGTASGENLQLQSTAHATKGKILLGSASAYDEVNDRLGLGTTSPTKAIELNGGVIMLENTHSLYLSDPSNDGIYAALAGGAGSLDITAYNAALSDPGGKISLYASDHSTKDHFIELTLDKFEVFDDATGDTIISATASGVAFDDVGVLTLEIAGTGGTLYGGDTASDNLTLSSSSNATKGLVYLGSASAYDEVNGRLGIGTVSPGVELDVQGSIAGRRKVGSISTYTLDDTADCNSVIFSSTDGGELTLPARDAGNDGCQVTLVNNGAAGAALIKLSPNVVDNIYGTCTNAAADVVFSTTGKDAMNTKATAKRGDSITVVGTGSKEWMIVSCTGVWAEEP